MTPTPAKYHSAVVTIVYFKEQRTRGTWEQPDGRRRWVIGAEKTTGDSLGERLISFTTLDPWKASLCKQNVGTGRRLQVRYKLTRYFDADLLHVDQLDKPAVAMTMEQER